MNIVLRRVIVNGLQLQEGDINEEEVAYTLCRAASNEKLGIIQFAVLIHGADINAVYKGCTPLTCASVRGHWFVVQ